MIRLRESFLDEPRFVGLSTDAIVLYLAVWGYCRREMTDGWVPESTAKREHRGAKKLASVLRELTEKRPSAPDLDPILVSCEGGYRIRKYLDENESREQIFKDRAAKAVAGARGGVASGEARSKQSASPDRSLRAPDPRSDLHDPGSMIQDPKRDPETRVPRDPLGLAPPGEDPDAYPGNVQTPLALTPPTPKDTKADLARQVFDAYLAARASKVGGGHPPALSDKRRALVATRLKDHPVEQLVDAVRGIWASSFHVEKGFTEFDLALRDAEHVERFAALAVPAADAPRRMRTPEEIAELQRLGRYPKHPPRPPETLEELKARNAEEAEESRRRAAIVPASAGAIQEAIRFGIFDEDDERERLASERRGT